MFTTIHVYNNNNNTNATNNTCSQLSVSVSLADQQAVEAEAGVGPEQLGL